MAQVVPSLLPSHIHADGPQAESVAADEAVWRRLVSDSAAAPLEGVGRSCGIGTIGEDRVYRGTSLIRNRLPLEPCSRSRPRALRNS